jgi:signal transduction histidine kinase
MLNSLSARLLVLTVLSVMLAEAVILVSSVSQFRREWLEERLWDAQVASLAMAASQDGRVDASLSRELLRDAMIDNVTFTRADGRVLALGKDAGPSVSVGYDLRRTSFLTLARDGLRTLLLGSEDKVRITGPARNATGEYVSVVVEEAPLRVAMIAHARHLLLMSLLISLLIAGLIYLCLFRLVVRPMQALAANMVRFSAEPEDARRVIPTSSRRDEIGTLQRTLRTMEDQVRNALAQKNGLASLGEAVAKVNHDLRNILATARLVSNRLSQNDDPGVRTISLTLMRAIDRAIEICSDTLRFGRPQDLKPRLIRFELRPLADEVGHAVGLSDESNPMFLNHVDPHLEIEADPEHLFRALQNLIRNAAEAIGDGFGDISVRCYDMGAEAVIEVADTGPGLPDHARDNLFKPFKGTTHEHGAGLGLVNVQEIMHAHGGEIRLVKSDAAGTVFRLHLPLTQRPPLQRAAG